MAQRDPHYTGEPSYDLLDAIRLVLLFHGGGDWNKEHRAEWLRITGTAEATTKVMCDHLRSALAVYSTERPAGLEDIPPDPNDVQRIVDRVRPILAHANPVIQSAVLADLLAIWIAGHQGPDGLVDQMRGHLLDDHVKLVRDLIPTNDAIIKRRRGG
jgi:hypothetical protein